MFLQNIISQQNADYKVTEAETVIDMATDSSLSAILHLITYKSSDFPLFSTSKPYFTIYSTDHETLTGAKIMWGEMDNPEFGGFVEREEIIVFNDGYQQESPYLMKIPTSKSGLVSDTYFLYYHTDATDTNNNGVQETHLVTTSGGDAPHLCTWTQRLDANGDNTLHLESGETHTGYARGIELINGDYVMSHSSVGGEVNAYAYSVSSNGIDWVRASIKNTNEIIPDGSGRTSRSNNISLFYYQNVLYGLFSCNNYVSVCKVDEATYLPTELKKDIISLLVNDVLTYWKFNLYIENGTMYIAIRDHWTHKNWHIVKCSLDIINS